MTSFTDYENAAKRQRKADGTFKKEKGGSDDLSPPQYESFLIHVDGEFLDRSNDTLESMEQKRIEMATALSTHINLPIKYFAICIEQRRSYYEYISDPHYHIHCAIYLNQKQKRYSEYGIQEMFPKVYKVKYDKMTFPHESYPAYPIQYVFKQGNVIQSTPEVPDWVNKYRKQDLPEKLFQDPNKREYSVNIKSLGSKAAREEFVLDVIQRYCIIHNVEYDYEKAHFINHSWNMFKENLHQTYYMPKLFRICKKEFEYLIN